MTLSRKFKKNYSSKFVAFFIFLLAANSNLLAQPINNNCSNASVVTIGSGGFGLGVFTSATSDMTNATVESTENFAPAIFVAGQDKKSVWYKFTLPTTRSVKVSLLQPLPPPIAAGDAGFTIYQSTNCLPALTEISSKFTPNPLFGDSYHPCVGAGDYLVQVSSKSGANGLLYIKIELGDPSPSPYDKPAGAQQFGTLTSNKVTALTFDVDCQSIDNAAENCLPNGSFKDYTKSTWHTFTTPNYFDWLSVLLAQNDYSGTDIKVGYQLYEGDGTVTPVNSLTKIISCDSLVTDRYYSAQKTYKCGELKTNTTYTIQLLYHKDFLKTLYLGVAWNGNAATKGPEPIASLPAPNKMGTLLYDDNGVDNNAADNLACNSRHSEHNCTNSMPIAGVTKDGYQYNLSTFFSFSLATASTLNIYATTTCNNPYLYVRLYKQSLNTNCNNLDTANIISSFLYNSSTLKCLEPGDYVVQVMGVDSAIARDYYYYGYLSTNTAPICMRNHLGNAVSLRINVKKEVASNKYSLAPAGAIDTINRVGNVMTPLQNGVVYQGAVDTLGCQNTLRPADTTCSPINNKVIYRKFAIADSGYVNFNTLTYPLQYKLYQGEADALASAQSVFAYPAVFTGLKPQTICMDYYTYCDYKNVCVVPGNYTLAAFGSENNLGTVDKPSFSFNLRNTKHDSYLTAQDMGSIIDSVGPSGGVRNSDIDSFSCRDNAVPINGYAPCSIYGTEATKAIYRQFYLSTPALLTISNYYYNYYQCGFTSTKTLFYGKATDGLAGLTPVGNQWDCFNSAQYTEQCATLPAGWYTIVSYGSGPSYSSPMKNINQSGGYGSSVGKPDQISISITVPACLPPQFNRPYKASVDTSTNQPYKVEWGPQTGHTAAYPVTYKRYTLNKENFNCVQDTDFIKQNLAACNPANVKVTFYVFKTTQESYLQIDDVPDGIWSSVYAFDARTADSVKLKTDNPLQPCLAKQGQIQFCKLMPGTYTLVLFAPVSYNCNSVTPSIYVDQVGYSRFDHAAKAYDFGAIKPDSVWYNGKLGDVNPLDNTRAASNDFFYCTTGAQEKDPFDGSSCYIQYNPEIYQAGNNIVLHPDNTKSPEAYFMDRRNLWYTFTVNQPGTVRVKVDNKTPGKTSQYPFAVYKTDVDASLPFTSIVAGGLVDSTAALGLTLIKSNAYYYYCYGNNDISFYNEPCSFKPIRYYILVDNRNAYGYTTASQMIPNHQVEVSILLDSNNAIPPKFDHFSLANDLGTVNSGKKKGATDNYTCATGDATDPIYAYTSCKKTLWYKFTTTTTGQIRYASFFQNQYQYYFDNIQLFRQVKPNDSTSTGLQHMPYTTTYYDNGSWAQQCITPGTYYIILPGCSAINEDVYPEIEIIPQAGDFCSVPAIAALNGVGVASASLIPDCHTIGTDYGEFGPTLTCPSGANTALYKTSWFRMDIGGTDTLDVTAYLVENTNATSTEIKYRLMTGDCGAMQEQSCVQDALTQNTYQCLLPGQKYFVQVFTPVTNISGQQVTGTLELKLSAIKHADTCAPVNTCLANANFTTTFDCTKDKTVRFNNFSTYGTGISYKWDFGSGGQTSAAVAPLFLYPAKTTDQVYSIKLVAQNTACGKKDSVTKTITIPARPYVDFGTDMVQCNGNPVTLDATSFTGATYLWQNGTTDPTFTAAAATGQNQYFVKVEYKNCISTDTINIFINPILKKPLQNTVLCAVDSIQLNAYRGYNETFLWNTGSTAANIYVKNGGIYWVDVKLNNCVIRDSFNVTSTAASMPLGNDTTVCLTSGGYNLNASISGAVSYQWQNSSGTANFNVTQPGIYWVKIDFGNCIITDSVTISGFPAAQIITSSASICSGNSYTLPWGTIVNTAAIYRDTIRRVASGCDSIIKVVTLTVNTKPSLGVDKNISICAGKTANLTTQFTTTGLTIDWTIAGAMVANPAAVSQAGLYRLIATNGAGCADTAFVTLTVDTKPDVGVDKSTSICPGFSINLTTQFVTTGLATNWTLAGVNVATPTAVTAAGAYQLIAANGAGCSDTAMVNLSVNPKPGLGSDKTVNICPGFSTDLTTQFTTTGLTESWSLGGATIGSPTAITAAGIYQLIAANGFGCTDTALVTVTVNARPSLGNDTAVAICSGNAINLTSLYTTNGLTSNWTTGGIAVSNPAAVSSAGSYQIIATNSSGCKDTALVSVTVNAKPAIGADKSISICPGFSADLTSQYSTTGLTSNWTLNGTTVTNVNAVTAAGNYRLIVTNGFGCSDTAFVTVTLSAKPNLGIDKSINICAGFSTDLTKQFVTTGLTSNWSLSNTAIASPTAITASGAYQLIASNGSGCSDTALVTVNISPKPDLGIDQSINICPGFSTDLTTQFVTTGLTSNWTVGGVAVTNPAAVATAGTYQLIVTNSAGCGDTAVVTVGLHPKPDLGVDKSINICPGFSADLTSQYTTTGLTTSWTIGGAAVSNPAAVNAAGNYRLIVSNSFGCTDTAFISVNLSAKPALGIDKSVNICAGFSTDLTKQFVTTGLTSNWSLNNAAIASPTAITAAGVYQLIATNGLGCSDTALVTVSISPKPNLGVDKTATACNGNSIDLNNQFTTTGLTAVWTRGGVVVNNPAAITVSGIYQLVATNTSGCSDTALCTVTIFSKPFVGRDTSINICPGSSFNLTAQYPVTGVATSWTMAGVAVPNPTAINQPGVYQLIGTNSNNCSDTALFTLTVDPNPTVVITNPANLCEPQTANLTLPSVTVGSSPNLTFSYFIDTTALTVFASPSAAPAGTYFIKGTNATGCFDIKKVLVFVYPMPVVKAGADTAICENTTALLHVAVSNILAPVFYQWEPATSIENSTASISIANPAATTVYKVTVKDTYGCNFNVVDEVKVTVQPPVNAFAGNDTTASVRVPHQLTATGGVQYLWSPAYPLNNPFISNPLAVLSIDTRFAVEVRDAIGCVGYDTVLIKVYEGITYYMPNAFSPNGDGLNDIFKPTPVGIVSTTYFRIFNRYGAIVFETNQWNKGWDGTYKGIPQQIGNYVWVIKGTGRNGKVVEMRGNVVLVR